MVKQVIITAGGVGKRMGSAIPKQFIELAGKPILMHTVNRFLEYDSNIKVIIVLPEAEIENWHSLCSRHRFNHKHIVVSGGDERFYSVKKGLEITEGESLIAIHDAVRPLVSVSTIEKCFSMAMEKGSAIPVISLAESVRELLPGSGSKPLDRSGIRLVQTPQVFRSDILQKAYDCNFDIKFTDDATVVEQHGNTVCLVEGNRENIKITTPYDLVIAEQLISQSSRQSL